MVLVLGNLVLVLVLSIGSIPGSGIGIDYQKAIFKSIFQEYSHILS